LVGPVGLIVIDGGGYLPFALLLFHEPYLS
jgi:hypothetical protein